jgi:hypothetical protein
MTSDVPEASVVARLGKGAAHPGPRGGEESGSTARAARGVRVQRDLCELGPAWLELAVWLAHSLRRYAARNRSMENTVSRDSM